MKLTTSCLLIGCGLAIFSARAEAHHSFAAAFDATKPVVVTGVVAEIRLVNPHSQFVVDVTDAAGKVETWRFEGSTPSSLIRSGFKPGTLKVGDNEVRIKNLGHSASPSTPPWFGVTFLKISEK